MEAQDCRTNDALREESSRPPSRRSAARRVSVVKVRDERTMDGAEALVISQIRTYGGFSVWWVEESAKRGTAILRLESSVTIRRTGGAYPFLEYEVV